MYNILGTVLYNDTQSEILLHSNNWLIQQKID